MADLILLYNATKRFLTRITYQEACRHYCYYVLRKYGNQAIVAFDGYGSEPSTKSMTHQRRSAGKGSATVTFQDGMKVTAKKDAFLANTDNKQRFITMLQRHLSEIGCHTLQAEGDADVLIVKIAVDSAVTHPTGLVGDNTDLLVLHCYHTRADSNDLDFRPEPKANSKERRVWNLLKVKAELGPTCCFCMPFWVVIRRLALTVLEKPRPSKKYGYSVYFQHQAKVFDIPGSTQAEAATAGENALVVLYGGKQGESLYSLRSRQYYEKVAARGQ